MEVTDSTLSNVLIYTYGCAERLMIMMIIIKHFHIFKPHSGELRMQKLKSHLVRTQSLSVLPLKPEVGHYVVRHPMLPARDFFLSYFYHSGPFTCIFSKPLSIVSCVGCG